MRGSSFKSILVTVAALGVAVPIATQAAISVGALGSALLTFDALPDVGDFSTLSITGANNDVYDPDVDIQTHPASTIITPLGMSATVPISANAISRWHSTLHFLQTPPTTVRYNVLMATLVNDSGANHSTLVINYTLGANDMAGTTRVEDFIPGHAVYYSLDGTTWARITALNSAAPPGDIGAKSTPVALSSPWLAGSTMYVLWLDDNSTANRDNAGDEEGGYTIDDLQFLFSEVVPHITADPAPSTTVAERGTLTLSVGQTGGTSIKWFKGATQLANGTSCVDGHDRTIAGATATMLTITGVSPADAGTYHCEVMNGAGTAVSANASVMFTPDMIAPTILYATCGANPNEFVVYFSEQMYDSCQPLGFGPVSETGNWIIEDVGVAGALGTAGITNMVPFQTGQTVLGLTTTLPHDPTKAVRIVWTADFPDASTAGNLLPSGSVMALCHTRNLVETNKVWRFDDSATPLDGLNPTWYSTAYNDSAWPGEGPGIFDGKRGAAGTPDRCRAVTVNGFTVGTCVNISNALNTITNETVYFRTHFNHSGSSLAVLQLLEMIDDGAVIYLNGSELTRPNISPGPVNYFTRAPVNVGEAIAVTTTLPGVPLLSGDNLLAAELKQNGANSSDFTFGLRVNQLVSTPPLSVSISYDGAGHVTVTWGGGTSAGTLRSTTSITTARPWPAVAGSPASPYTTTSTGPQRFYEVSDP